MSKSRPRLYSRTGLMWLGVITSLLIASSMFTLFRVKGVITELTKAKVEGESQQVIEKFMIIEELLGQWLESSLDELKRNILMYGEPSLREQTIDSAEGAAEDQSIPVCLLVRPRQTSFPKLSNKLQMYGTHLQPSLCAMVIRW